MNGNNANTNKVNPNVPSNVYLLNVAFYSFAIFALFQMFIAISIARSQAMIADSCAMVIDSLTYLFNSWAERIKNKSLEQSAREVELDEVQREIKRIERTKQRLLLEIAPPLCSVLTLIGLTISVSKEAVDTLFEYGLDAAIDDDTTTEPTTASEEEQDPNVAIMFFFSGLNLALDILNVTCFARAKHAFGFAVIDQDRHRYMLAYDGSLHNVYADSLRNGRSEVDLKGLDYEEEAVTVMADEKETDVIINAGGQENMNYSSISQEEGEGEGGGLNIKEGTTSLEINRENSGFKEVNLNMCSAYTHVFADTLRSTAVLLAAGISYTFQIGAPAFVDAVAALAVSLIILMSLGPLLRGIYHAWSQLRRLSEIAEQMKGRA